MGNFLSTPLPPEGSSTSTESCCLNESIASRSPPSSVVKPPSAPSNRAVSSSPAESFVSTMQGSLEDFGAGVAFDRGVEPASFAYEQPSMDEAYAADREDNDDDEDDDDEEKDWWPDKRNFHDIYCASSPTPDIPLSCVRIYDKEEEKVEIEIATPTRSGTPFQSLYVEPVTPRNSRSLHLKLNQSMECAEDNVDDKENRLLNKENCIGTMEEELQIATKMKTQETDDKKETYHKEVKG